MVVVEVRVNWMVVVLHGLQDHWTVDDDGPSSLILFLGFETVVFECWSCDTSIFDDVKTVVYVASIVSVKSFL